MSLLNAIMSLVDKNMSLLIFYWKKFCYSYETNYETNKI